MSANGTARTKAGAARRRYRCVPLVGDAHTFTVVLAEDAAQVVQWSPPPACPRHLDGHVVRNGKYGTRSDRPRQRYLCTPTDGTKPHSFTPALPRDHVHVGAEQCAECDELRGVHRGDIAVARRHTWSARIVARGLAKLAAGGSYSQVSQWALRAAGSGRRSRDGQGTPWSAEQSASKNSWHVAADWVEVFGPVVFETVDQKLRRAEAEARGRIDAAREKGEPVTQPLVWLLDDVPVYARERSGRSRSDGGFNVLVVAQMRWTPTADPFAVRGGRPFLRLIRAMPRNMCAPA